MIDRFPARPGEITSQWLTDALRKSGELAVEARVTRFGLDRIGEGRGFMGTVVRITLDYDGETLAPDSVVAKFPLVGDSAHLRRQLEGAPRNLVRRAEREILFYRRLAAESGVSTKIHYTAAEPDSARFVVLMEDLTRARAGDALRGATEAECEAGIRWLARFHARFWESPRLDAIDWMPRYGHNSKGSQRIFEKRAPRFIDKFSSRLAEPIRHATQKLVPLYGKLLSRFSTAPRTVLHGDFHLDNILFEGAEPLVHVVDWQTVSLGRASFDFAMFLNDAVLSDSRPQRDRELAEIYHGQLLAQGVRYPLEAWLDDVAYGVLLICGTTILWLANADLELYERRERLLAERAIDEQPAFRAALSYDLDRLLDGLRRQ